MPSPFLPLPSDAPDTQSTQPQPFVTLHPGDPSYPATLMHLSSPPKSLYLRGAPGLLEQPILAIVGSRNPTAQGLLDATAFARELSLTGYTIISGLALGIDAGAHQGGMMERGKTIAVMGTGIDRLYPPQNLGLAQHIATAGGLIMTEFEPNSPAHSWHFPHRNRLIAALCQGCLVVEASLDSGSLITARLALELGHEVFALPGSIHSPQSKGCHHLIKEGAKLVESVRDILDELPRLPSTLAASGDSKLRSIPDATQFLDEESYKLWQNMGNAPVSMDRLAKLNALTLREVASLLTLMELAGHVALLPGGMAQKLVKMN